ncbi:MAG: MmgE/PrpD family protein [Burkholderiaceae bacterium]|nr:MmgE/PrpD family protein [Burkholderiaceae bacterium]
MSESTTTRTTVSQRLATWVHELDASQVPPEVLHEAKLRILDITGAMLGGRDTALVEQVRAACFLPEQGSGTPVIGFGGSTGVAAAALLQGTMGCVLEFDDSHVATGLHASTPVVSAAVAKGQQKGLSGPALIEAVLVGNELTCRLGLAAPGMFHKAGFHPTGVLAVFGASYALSRMVRADALQTANAAGICGSLSSGIMASWEDGTAAKSLHAGWAASSALQALNFAAQGVSGPGVVYEGRFGFYKTHAQAPGYEFDYGAIEAELGQRWEVMNVAPRAYPCGHYIQPFIDAALQLNATRPVAPDDIADVLCLVADYMVPLICEPALEKTQPATSWHARYSLPFCIAECFIAGSFTKHSLALKDLTDARYAALTRKVRYMVDPTATDRTQWSGEVRVTLKSGEEIRHRIDHMHGTPANPITQDELIAKFFHNASGVLSQSQSEQTVERLLALDRADDIRTVFAPLCSAALGAKK